MATMSDNTNKKYKALLGFAIKAGKVVYGVDNIEQKLRKVHLIICDNTLAENSQKKIFNMAKEQNKQVVKIEECLKDIVFKENCKVVGILDEQFSQALKKAILGE